jgi:hypothetical protein
MHDAGEVQIAEQLPVFQLLQPQDLPVPAAAAKTATVRRTPRWENEVKKPLLPRPEARFHGWKPPLLFLTRRKNRL